MSQPAGKLRRVLRILFVGCMLVLAAACRSIVPTEPTATGTETATAAPTSIIVPVPSPTAQTSGSIIVRGTVQLTLQSGPYTFTAPDGRVLQLANDFHVLEAADYEPGLTDAITQWANGRGWTYVGSCTDPANLANPATHCSYAEADTNGLVAALLYSFLRQSVGSGATVRPLMMVLILERQPSGWAVIHEHDPFQ